MRIRATRRHWAAPAHSNRHGPPRVRPPHARALPGGRPARRAAVRLDVSAGRGRAGRPRPLAPRAGRPPPGRRCTLRAGSGADPAGAAVWTRKGRADGPPAARTPGTRPRARLGCQTPGCGGPVGHGRDCVFCETAVCGIRTLIICHAAGSRVMPAGGTDFRVVRPPVRYRHGGPGGRRQSYGTALAARRRGAGCHTPVRRGPHA